jgi:hypothetical protein
VRFRTSWWVRRARASSVGATTHKINTRRESETKRLRVAAQHLDSAENLGARRTTADTMVGSEIAGAQDTIYLCNFRVSVDGEWLCLKELQDVEFSSAAGQFSPTSPTIDHPSLLGKGVFSRAPPAARPPFPTRFLAEKSRLDRAPAPNGRCMGFS